jgi:hypothetical protein
MFSTMTNDLQKLRKINAKTFRKAKKWYLGYVISQFAVLAFAITSIFTEVNSKLNAIIVFLGVLTAELVRWRSDYWKSQGESAKRKWEMADGFGVSVDGKYIADWLASKPRGLLSDVSDYEIRGLDFDSGQPLGPRRAVENTEESAWWSKHESRKMVVYMSFILVVVIVAAFIALALGIGALKAANVPQSGSSVQTVGGIICSVLMFVFSINLVRLLVEFWSFASEAEGILRRCAVLLKARNISQGDALAVMHDYQTARNSTPLIPTFIWKFHGNHLREQWLSFRPKQYTSV